MRQKKNGQKKQMVSHTGEQVHYKISVISQFDLQNHEKHYQNNVLYTDHDLNSIKSTFFVQIRKSKDKKNVFTHLYRYDFEKQSFLMILSKTC